MERNEYRKKGYLPFCIEEIKTAERNGVSSEQIEQFMNNPRYDNLQLKQIRLGLQSGIDVSSYARLNIPADEMEVLRIHLLKEKENRDEEAENEKKLANEKVRTEVNKQKLGNTITVFRIIFIIAGILVFAIILFSFKGLYDWYNQDLYISFTSDNIVLEYKEIFVPEKYIKSYSDYPESIIIFPSFDASELGNYSVTYQLSNGIKTIKEDLNIKVIDSTKPSIKLLKNEIKMIREMDSFNPEEYILEISDNYDPSPLLTVDDIDWDKDEQSINYVVEDLSGNVSSAQLKVIIEDKPVEKPKPAYTSSNSSQPSSDSTSASSNITSESNNNAGNNQSIEYVQPSEVYCHNVSVPVGTDPTSAAYSTFDGISGNLAVSLQYPDLNTSVPGQYPVYYINQNTGDAITVAYVTVTE